MNRKSLSKLLSLTLVTMISVSVLSGCGSKVKKEENTSTPTSTTVSNEPGWKKDTTPITFDWYLNFSWFPNKWGVDSTSKYITKKTGVSLNLIVPAGNENEKLNTMIASGKLPDFLTLGWYEDAVKKMQEGNLVLPLNKLAEKYDTYFFKVSDKQKLSWYKQEDGNTYGYPNASSSPASYEKTKANVASNQTFLVRKDIYESIGKPDMRTPEGFLNALKLAKEKFPTVNGQPLIPLAMTDFNENGNASIEAYLQNLLAIPQEKDGKLYDRVTDPEYLTWLKTFRKANEQGLLAKDVFIDKRPQMEEKISQGRYFSMIYQRTDLAAQEAALYAKDKNQIYIAVDGPADSKKDAPQLSVTGIAGWTVTLISKDCKDPKRAIEFMSYLISEEGQRDVHFGEKGVSWDTIDGKDQFKPEVAKLLNTDRSAFDKKYGASETFWMLMDTDMILPWQAPTQEPLKQMEDWTKGKTVPTPAFDGIDPKGDSDEGVISTKIAQLWGKTLPKLLQAKSDSEFDTLFKEFTDNRKSYGFDQVVKFRQVELDKNKKKLAQ